MSATVAVYKISNLIDDRVYVGSSIDYNRRINEHKNDLKKQSHHNLHLQRFVNKYGIEILNFEILEECPINQIHQREEFWFSKFTNKFNISVSATAPMLGKTHSNDYCKKRSELMSAAGNINYGKKRPPHVVDAIRNAQTGRRKTQELRTKISINNPNRKNIEIISITTNERLNFSSIAEAAKFLGVTHQSVSKALHNYSLCKNHKIQVI